MCIRDRTDRQTQTETDRDRERHRERDRQTDRQTERDRETERDTDRDKDNGYSHDPDPDPVTPTDLFGQQLSAQTVEGDELPGQQTGVKEALGHQHDFANQLEVRHHHSAWSETPTVWC